MKSYIHLYKTNSEFTASYNGSEYVEPWLSLTEEGMTINYNKPKLTAITFGAITWVTDIPATGGTATKDNCEFKVYAKYDNGTSVDISSDATVEGTLVVEPSTEGQRHEIEQPLTLTASYSGFTATGNVTVYQAAVDFSTKPLTFNILSDGKINWVASRSDIAKTIEYKLNDGEWISITSNTDSSAPSIEANSGDKLQFRGNNEQYATGSSAYNTFSGSTALFEAEGNIMSLIYGDDFKNKLTISSDYAFGGLFSDCVNLVSAENLVLPATTLASVCYFNMFGGCTSLTTAPELPATTLAQGCYVQMFSDCTSLTTAPKLPATSLAQGCYQNMFYNCTSLTTAPALPAITLAGSCYASMFNGCTSLTTVTELPATSLADNCYFNMFRSCTLLTTPPALPATTLAEGCYQEMFDGCTSLTTAPELPATTLAQGCYVQMFSDCTSLTTAPKLPATSLAQGCYQNMFYNCTSLTTAPALPAITLAGSCYASMFNGCTSLTTVTELPATTLATWCYDSMFLGCTSLTSAPELPAITLENYCYQNMFDGCTSLTTAPELPATTLKSQCYRYRFRNCTSLNYIKCLATDISASRCTTGWVRGVASKGTFVKASSMTSWTPGDNGIPTGWTVQNA